MKKIFYLFVVVAITFLATFYFLSTQEMRKEYLTNITELYSLFTPHMKDFVDYRLQVIECAPNKYYYEDSAICFVCKKMDACFKYGWVNRPEGKRMNPLDIPYLKFNKFNVKVANFYYDGLASEFNCRKLNKKLNCEHGVSFLLENGRVSMKAERANFKEVAEKLCKKIGSLEDFTCEESICYCGDIYVGFANGEVKYGYYE